MNQILNKFKSLSRNKKILIFIILLIVIIFVFSGDEKQVQIKNENYKTDNIEKIANNISQQGEVILKPTEILTKVINNDNKPNLIQDKPTSTSIKLYNVVKVVDGDTVDISIDGKTERIRLIGINTPETVDPRKPVECFGKEAADKAKLLLSGKKVSLGSDITQGELDKYNRLLRYVFLEDGTNFNLLMIKEGYAYEYTYNTPYKFQIQFKEAQKEAEKAKIGLWGDICQIQDVVITRAPTTTQVSGTGSCAIKGNISSTKEKIYHMIGCGSYNKTTIDESGGEKWFCTEQEAINAGWRKALNCN